MKHLLFEENISSEIGLHEINVSFCVSLNSLSADCPGVMAYDDIKISIINYVIMEVFKQLIEYRLISKETTDDIRYIIEDYLEKAYQNELQEFNEIDFESINNDIY
jgi:hypothetical protein